VYSAVCQNGVGLTKGTISGLLVADLACGVDNPLIADMQALGQPDALPPRPFLDVGVRARLGWELWRHRAEA
jgi:glycine/D-amino acid oxidase-like deaminating enzyme